MTRIIAFLALLAIGAGAGATEPAKPKTVEPPKEAVTETLSDAEVLAIENLRLRFQLLTQQVMMAHGCGPDDKIAPDGRTIIRSAKK